MNRESIANRALSAPSDLIRVFPLPPFLCFLPSFTEEKSVVPGIGLGESTFPRESCSDWWLLGFPFAFSFAFVDGSGAGLAAVRGSDFFTAAIACCHTAPIGNLGMRTQATRHFDDTGNLHGVLRTALVDMNRDV